MVKPAKNRMRDNFSEALDRAPVRRILPERYMRTPLIIIAGELRENPPKMLFIG